MTKVTLNGAEFDMDVVANYMDDELRESLHGSYGTDQDFLDAYAAAHEERFGEVFTVN